MKLQSRVQQPARRGGAVIIVVVSLMATLAFLGLFFYNWTNQERINAEYFSDTDPVEIDPDPIFNFGLQQAIVSTKNGLTNSALYGSRWSLLAHIMGPMTDDGAPTLPQPYTGRGIVLTNPTATGFQLEYNNTTTRNETDFVLNMSPLAGGGTINFNPAAGYTYPDINSLFLAVDYIDPLNTARRIIKPSFALPGYFPSLRTGGFGDWYSMSGSTPAYQVMRPHENLTDRYLNTATQALSGDRNRIIDPFPFNVGNLGVWTGSGNDYDFDYDLDGDGIEDSIVMDLDHPLVDLPNGRQVVPMYYWKIIDLDGLFNVNVHGQLPEFAWNSINGQASLFDDVGNRGTFAHYSNLGLSPSEINLAYGLYADPSSSEYIEQSSAIKDWALLNHRGMLADRFGGGPTGQASSAAFDRISTANMELAMMLLGRPEFRDDLNYMGSNIIPGRYGETSQLIAGLNQEGNSPGSGVFNGPGKHSDLTMSIIEDDDADRLQGGSIRTSKIALLDVSIPTDDIEITIPPFVHPLDYAGTGNHSLALDNSSRSIIERDRSALTGARILSPGTLTNNPMRYPRYPDNAAWHDQEPTPLAAYDTYRDALGGDLQLYSRNQLVDEADEVFVSSAYNNVDDDPFRAQEIAALQLSDSDWNQQRQASRVRALAPFNFEYNRKASEIRSQFTTDSWDRLQFAMSRHPDRTWEFNHSPGDGTQRFPPQFGVAASRHEIGTISANDPFRPEVRRLLTKLNSSSSVGSSDFQQRRLNINRILSDDTNAGGDDAFDSNKNPVYRDLIPHATGTLTNVAAMHHDNTAPSGMGHPYYSLNAINTDADVREWWARYDRQRLARDIYVLLYTLAAHDGTNINTDVTTVAVDVGIAKEMAQFAVNYVDALDHDNVITRFEYDNNLSDGWASSPSEVVYGVEHQQLAFSEVMLFDTNETTSDVASTLHDESNTEHRFLYFEVRNLSPFPVDFSQEQWRIVRRNSTTNVWECRVNLLDGVVGAGENYLFGCHDNTGVVNGGGNAIGSDLYADYTGGSELELIVPSAGTVTIADNQVVPAESLDLDLTGPNHSARRGGFLVNATTMYAGTTLVHSGDEAYTGTMIADEEFELTLERLANPSVTESQSEWIEVDRIRVPLPTNFDINDGATQSDVNTAVTDQSDGIFSTERLHPLTGTDDQPYDRTTGPAPFHTLDRRATFKHRANYYWQDQVGGPYWIWQPHFDRDYSSIMELLSIPLYGTMHFADTSPTPFSQSEHGGPPRNLVEMPAIALSGHRTAQRRFRFPASGTGGNQWYRLLGLLEIGPRAEQSIDPPIDRRTPGRINLNALRHERVLAGLVDDTVHHNYLDSSFDWDEPTQDTAETGTPARHWMEDLIQQRDGGDELPGTQYDAPFRPETFINDATSPNLNASLLRRINIAGVSDLGMFDAGRAADLAANDVDYHTRHRILAKIANNTTTRSHVFAIWTGFSLHEAHVDSGDVKVGARAEDLPTYRQFIVVDMSRLEEAYDSNSGTFDFRKFIIHRQMLP